MRVSIVSLVLLITGCQSSGTENVAESQISWPPIGDASTNADVTIHAEVQADVGLYVDAYADTNTAIIIDTGGTPSADSNSGVYIDANVEAEATENTDANADATIDINMDSNTDTRTNPASTATEFVAQMGIGWNLGNSLDVPEGETSWGNPVTTEKLIQAVAAQGFRVIRVPVTWSLHMGAGPDFRIDSSWMDRVEEVVNYVLNNGMFAIVNLHHDGADDYAGVEWITLNDQFGNVTNENNTLVEARFVKVWEQIAARFINYDERLLFESMNEIHDGYDPPKQEYYNIINNLNQVFVNTVRVSGGSNATRYLMVPGYNTNIEYTLAGFVRPNDSVPNKLILSVHYYDPYEYTIMATTRVWGAAYPGSNNYGQEDSVQSQFSQLRTQFGDNGLPIIMGEYGAVNISGSESYRRYYMEYITKAAKDNAIVPIYWDNGGIGDGQDKFALFDRNSNAVIYPDIVDKIMRAALDSYTINDIIAP